MCCCIAANVADDKCYETFNTAGRFNGHCGLNVTSSGYLQCADEYVADALLIHCFQGNNSDETVVRTKCIVNVLMLGIS